MIDRLNFQSTSVLFGAAIVESIIVCLSLEERTASSTCFYIHRCPSVVVMVVVVVVGVSNEGPRELERVGPTKFTINI